MSSAMDKAMMALSMDEEDLPFDMPDLPQFSCCEKNSLSVQDKALERRLGRKVEKVPPPLVIKEDDPLFGVLREDQVSIHPLLGRPRIDPMVLEGMRQYLLVVDGEERRIREERVKSSVADTEKDPLAQKTVLRLEEAPIISNDFTKGRGIVFGYDSVESSLISSSANEPAKLSEGDLRNVLSLNKERSAESFGQGPKLVSYSEDSSSSLFRSTEYVPGFFEAGASGTKQRKTNRRRRPYISKRSLKGVGSQSHGDNTALKEGLAAGFQEKRK
ncbi:unnamed protein product, partial [Arabidopsis halleri]